MDVFDLVAKLSLDQTEYESGLSNASTTASNFGSGLKTAMGVGAVAVAGVTTAVVGVTSAFSSGISSVADYTDHIDKQSQKMNLSAESYQEWSAVMEHSGTTIDSMQSSMKTLASAVETGNDAFEQLGLSQEELSSMDNEEIFSSTITALQNVDDETERTYLASQLLGKGATELGALLNTSAEDTQAMKDRVKELGGVMSDDAVKAGASFKDSLQDMQTAFTGLKNNMLVEFLPSVTTVMDGLTEVFAGNSDEGIGMITEGIEGFIDNLSEVIPEISEVGGSIMTALIDALTENLDSILTAGADVMEQLGNAILNNLPTIMSTAGQIVGKIASGIISNLPQLVSTGLTILTNLMNGIGKNMSTVIPTVTSVILQIVNTLISNVPQIIDAGLTIFLGVVDGLIEAIPIILDALPDLIDNIVSTIESAVPMILEAGTTLFMALVDALPEILDALISALPEIIDSVVEFLTGDGLSNILDGAITMFLAIVDALPEILEALLSALGTLIVDFIADFPEHWEDIKQGAKDLFTKIVDAVGDIWDSLSEALGTLIDDAVAKVKEFWQDFKDAGKYIMEGLKAGMESVSISLVASGATQTALDAINSTAEVKSPSKATMRTGRYMAEGLGIGWEEGMEEVDKGIEDDLNYSGNIDISTNYDSNGMITSASASALTEADIDRIISGLQITINNYTQLDGDILDEHSYDYAVNRIGNETTALAVAQGGY